MIVWQTTKYFNWEAWNLRWQTQCCFTWLVNSILMYFTTVSICLYDHFSFPLPLLPTHLSSCTDSSFNISYLSQSRAVSHYKMPVNTGRQIVVLAFSFQVYHLFFLQRWYTWKEKVRTTFWRYFEILLC